LGGFSEAQHGEDNEAEYREGMEYNGEISFIQLFPEWGFRYEWNRQSINTT
jgi:hypothetical protein